MTTRRAGLDHSAALTCPSRCSTRDNCNSDVNRPDSALSWELLKRGIGLMTQHGESRHWTSSPPLVRLPTERRILGLSLSERRLARNRLLGSSVHRRPPPPCRPPEARSALVPLARHHDDGTRGGCPPILGNPTSQNRHEPEQQP